MPVSCVGSITMVHLNARGSPCGMMDRNCVLPRFTIKAFSSLRSRWIKKSIGIELVWQSSR
jgi:hypothetical protein